MYQNDVDKFYYRDYFVYAPNQWETTLQCNIVSHWLGAYTKRSLPGLYICSLRLTCGLHPKMNLIGLFHNNFPLAVNILILLNHISIIYDVTYVIWYVCVLLICDTAAFEHLQQSMNNCHISVDFQCFTMNIQHMISLWTTTVPNIIVPQYNSYTTKYTCDTILWKPFYFHECQIGNRLPIYFDKLSTHIYRYYNMESHLSWC